MPIEWMPWRRSAIRLVRAFYDMIAVTVAYVLFVIWVLDGFNLTQALLVIGVATAASAPALYLPGVHRHVWRYVSVRDAAVATPITSSAWVRLKPSSTQITNST